MARRILVLVVGVLITLLVVGFVLPGEVVVERSIDVARTPAEVFAHVNRFRAWSTWEPWGRRDPSVEYSYEGPEAGVGAIARWTSKSTGDAELRITGVETNRRIELAMVFNRGQVRATGTFEFEIVDGGTRVTWRDRLTLGRSPLARWMGLFMDGMVGADKECGLAALKDVAEGHPTRPPDHSSSDGS